MNAQRPAALLFRDQFPQGNFCGSEIKAVGLPFDLVTVRFVGIKIHQFGFCRRNPFNDQRALLNAGRTIPASGGMQIGPIFGQAQTRSFNSRRVRGSFGFTTDIQVSLNVSAAGQALLFTFEPRNGSAELELSGRQIFGKPQRNQENDRSGIDVSGQSFFSQLLWNWPLNGTGGNSLRQFPFDLSSRSRVSPVAPISMSSRPPRISSPGLAVSTGRSRRTCVLVAASAQTTREASNDTATEIRESFIPIRCTTAANLENNFGGESPMTTV